MTPLLALFDSIVWWSNLTTAQQLFYGLGILAGVATLIMAVLGFFGIGDHDHVDAVADPGDGTSLFSTKPLTGFFLGFGWTGGIALEMGASMVVATAIAFGVGLALMLSLAWAIRLIYSMRSDGTRQINDAIGAIGTVYVSLPANRASGGQINVTVSGRLETISAVNAATRAIPSGEKVKVVGVVDPSTVIVEPL